MRHTPKKRTLYRNPDWVRMRMDLSEVWDRWSMIRDAAFIRGLVRLIATFRGLEKKQPIFPVAVEGLDECDGCGAKLAKEYRLWGLCPTCNEGTRAVRG